MMNEIREHYDENCGHYIEISDDYGYRGSQPWRVGFDTEEEARAWAEQKKDKYSKMRYVNGIEEAEAEIAKLKAKLAEWENILEEIKN